MIVLFFMIQPRKSGDNKLILDIHKNYLAKRFLQII